jgi:metallo-beta-lactamase class B
VLAELCRWLHENRDRLQSVEKDLDITRRHEETTMTRFVLSLGGMVLALLELAIAGQELPKGVTAADLANNNKLFIELATKALHWDEPADPIKIVGPLYFVGTRGLSSWLFVTSEGNILLNTGTPKSGPMIVDSIRKLGFKPEDIKIIINGHGHSDHAGAFAFIKEQTHAQVAIMQPDVAMVEDGGKSDFHYGKDWQVMGQPPVKVDRILRSGDTVKLGDVILTGYNTPGHTKGATTWVTTLVDGGKAYTVAFPDGAGFNPGYQVAKPEEYPGINQDYRDTLHFLESLHPDIWLAHHTEYFDLEGKRTRAPSEGVKAWVDPDGYRQWVASKRRAFENEVDREMGVKKPPVAGPASETAAPAVTSVGGTVTVANFVRAETDRYFAQTAKDGAFWRAAPQPDDDAHRRAGRCPYESRHALLVGSVRPRRRPIDRDAARRGPSFHVDAGYLRGPLHHRRGLRPGPLHLRQEKGGNAIRVRHHPDPGQSRGSARSRRRARTAGPD